MSWGKPWTTEENELIERMIAEGASVARVKERLHNRTFRAVENQIHRLGLRLSHSGGTHFSSPIMAERIIKREKP